MFGKGFKVSFQDVSLDLINFSLGFVDLKAFLFFISFGPSVFILIHSHQVLNCSNHKSRSQWASQSFHFRYYIVAKDLNRFIETFFYIYTL